MILVLLQLRVVLAGLVGVVVLIAAFYFTIMFPTPLHRETIGFGSALVHAFYFSLQTATTVGYGDWRPPNVSELDPRVFKVKILALGAMLAGPTLFTLTLDSLLKILQARLPPPARSHAPTAPS